MVQPLTVWSVLRNLTTERCFMAQQSHCRVEGTGISAPVFTADSLTTATRGQQRSVQCWRDGWVRNVDTDAPVTREMRCVPLRSECPPTRLANIGSFEKGWEDGDDSHPVTCRSKSEVWVRRQCPSAFQRHSSGQPSTSQDPSCGNVRVCALRIRVLFITALLLTVTLEAARKHVHPKAPATGAGHGTTAPWAGTEPS